MLEGNPYLEEKNGVLSMLDGTLFLRQRQTGQEQFEYLTGIKSIDSNVISNFNDNLNDNIEYCSLRSIPYFHIIFPIKAYAYRAEFDAIGVKLNSLYTDAFLSDSVYYPVDVTPEYYRKNDTHCSFYGNFKILSVVLRGLGVDIGGFNFRTKVVKSKGDLSIMCGQDPIDLEVFTDFNIPAHVNRFSTKEGLKGNSGDVHFCINLLAPIKKRVLLFGDSFFVYCLEWLSNLFEEVIYIRSPFVIHDVADVLSPDIILTGNAERYLVNTKSRKETPPYFLHYIEGFNNEKMLERDVKAISALFSGRYSERYKNWVTAHAREELVALSSLLIDNINSIKVECFTEIREEILLKCALSSSSFVDRLRSLALFYEEKDILVSLKLMSIAHEARPSGPFIAKKLSEYKEKCNKV
ncbi:hypothetical protein JFQ74_002401 [Vibrio parahaemolyticus]|nr:hypothetical protein [Vibrio parahaemolyticus]